MEGEKILNRILFFFKISYKLKYVYFYILNVKWNNKENLWNVFLEKLFIGGFYFKLIEILILKFENCIYFLENSSYNFEVL